MYVARSWAATAARRGMPNMSHKKANRQRKSTSASLGSVLNTAGPSVLTPLETCWPGPATSAAWSERCLFQRVSTPHRHATAAGTARTSTEESPCRPRCVTAGELRRAAPQAPKSRRTSSMMLSSPCLGRSTCTLRSPPKNKGSDLSSSLTRPGRRAAHAAP